MQLLDWTDNLVSLYRYLDSILVASLETSLQSDQISAIVLEAFDCVTAMGIIIPEKTQCFADVHESLLLSSGKTISQDACCQTCIRENHCTGCSYSEGECSLFQGVGINDIESSIAVATTHYRARIISQSGCECLPSYFESSNLSAVCVAGSETDSYGCKVDPLTCVKNYTNVSWDFCNGMCIYLELTL